MLFATAAILFGVLSITFTGKVQTLLAVLISAVIIAIGIAHCYYGDVTAFRIWFLFMIQFIFTQCLFILPAKVRVISIRRNARHLILYGSGNNAGLLIPTFADCPKLLS